MNHRPAATPQARQSWCMASEIDWGRIDLGAAQGDPGLLIMIRRAALRAARRTVGLSHLLAACADDSRLSPLLSRELHDSWKHFHALRSYLDIIDYASPITDAEIDQHRRAAPEPAPKRSEDAAARITVLVEEAARDGATFGMIRSRSTDPALARLADRIAADREQHSLALAAFISHATVGSDLEMTA